MLSLPSGWNKLLAKLGYTRNKRRERRQLTRPFRFEALESRRVLAAVTVNTGADIVDGSVTSIAALIASPGTDGKISLREAILAANSDTTDPSDTITFDSALNSTQILLNRTLGQLDITSSLTIDATTMYAGLTINADDPTGGFHNNGDGIRIFNITDASAGVSPPSVTMIGLTLTGADPSPGASTPQGGAIRSEAFLTLKKTTIVENGAGVGAGVYVAVAGGGSGPRIILNIENSKIEHNSAWTNGGGVFVQFSSVSGGTDTVSISGSSLSHNIAGPLYSSGSGGGLHIASGYGSNTNHEVIISSSTLSTNSADVGGAIYHQASSRVDLSVVQGSSVSGNTATTGSGGGIYSRAYNASEVRIEKSTVSDNATVESGTKGGGLFVRLNQSSSLVVENSVVSGNTSQRDGGGIYAKAFTDFSNLFPTPRAITISRSVISGNTALKRGGGLYAFNFEGTETLVEETRVTGNHVPNTYAGGYQGNGGGIYAYLWGNPNGTNTPNWTITRSTVDNNDAEHEGGGIFVCGKYFGNFVATNSTFSTNRTTNQSTGAGGGMFIARYPFGTNESIDAYLRNTTVTLNESAIGGGIGMADLSNVRVRIANSIVSQNVDHQSAPNNLDGRVIVADLKHNLIGTGSTILDHATGQVVYQDQPPVNTIPAGNNNIMGVAADSPLLGALSNNGGATPTHSLLAGSPAIDKGSNALASDPLTAVAFTTDQRGTGFPRLFDIASVANGAAGHVDIGAYEIGLPKVIQVIVDGSSSTHAPYDFNTVVGSGEQIRTVPVGGANRVQVRFSEAVTMNASHLAVQSARTLSFYSGSFSLSGTTATWQLNSGVFPADQLILKVDDAVSGLAGLLDGDWTNPTSLTATGTSVFPSGDGIAGGDFNFYFTILSGDFSRNNVVDSGDWILWRKFSGKTSGAFFSQGDANGDGAVNQTDYNIWSSQFGLDFTLWPT